MEEMTTSSTPDNSRDNSRMDISKEGRIGRIYMQLLDLFSIPKRFQEKTFKNYKPSKVNEKAFIKVQEYAKTFAERYKAGDWLILSGGYGLGKTHLAFACARECLRYFAEDYIEKNPGAISYYGYNSKVIFRTSSDIVQEIRDSYDSDQINEKEVMFAFKNIPLLIIDDLGTEKASEWQHEKMYTILDYRYREKLPTIITTNLSTYGLKEQVAERVVERMIEAAGNGQYLWRFEGKSHRQKSRGKEEDDG